MTLIVTHPFVSTQPDDPVAASAGEVVPSNWNAQHTVAGTLPQSQYGQIVATGGTTARDIADYFGDFLNVRDFGATGNGVTDDSSAIQLALDTAAASGSIKAIYFPAGNFVINTGLTVSGFSIAIYGSGYKTQISPADGVTAFTFDTDTPVILEKMAIVYASNANVANIGVVLTGPGANGNGSSIFRDLQILRAYIAIEVIAGTAWVMTNLKIENFGSAGIVVSNFQNPDAGDCTITDSYILDGTYTNIGIYYQSSSGLRVSNNKILNCDVGFQFALANAATLGLLQINHNNFDGMNAAINFSRQGAAGTCDRIVIAANIFNLSTYGIYILVDATSPWISDLLITDDIYYDSGAGTSTFGFINSASNVMIDDILLHSTTMTTTGLTVGADVTNIIIGTIQKIASLGAAFSADTISATSVLGPPVNFAKLYASPEVGMVGCVNNCSTNAWGAVADGAGALTVQVWYNGTNWTVIGK